jgi:tetratricopeptide (TPR) repeat protein
MTSASPEGPKGQHEDSYFDSAAGTRNEMGGMVVGASIQARDVKGGIHVHQPGLRFPSPNQLPPPVRLTGRAADTAAMDAARDNRVIVLTGAPGIGKTALAVNWAHDSRGDFPDGALFADLHGYAPDGPASASKMLARFLRALGTDPRQVPLDLAELTGMYRSLMIDKRMLVVLDDAVTAAQVTPLLPPSPESVAVVTSRVRLGGLAMRGARVLQLDGLDADAALELLARTMGDERVLAQPHAARELVELCARSPLALCVAGARLAARSRWPLSEMVDAMFHERERLAALTMDDDIPVHTALHVSYRALPGEAQKAYRLMGLFPGTHFDSTVAAAAMDVPRFRAKQLLGVLTDANLLDDAAGSQYRFHDLTRLHAREMAEREDPQSARDEAIRRMLDFFLSGAASACRTVMPYRTDVAPDIRYPPGEPVRFAGPSSALGWLDRELPNVIAAARLALSERRWSVTWQLSDAMRPLFVYRGRHAERLELDRLGLEAASASGDPLAEATMLYKIGRSVMGIGQLDQAQDYFERALSAWRGLGKRDRAAGSLRRLGFVAMARDRPDDAIGWFTRALDEYRELADARHVALTLTDLGDSFTETGRADAAISALAEAGSLLTGSSDPYNQARVLTRLGRAHQRAGRLEIAADYLDRALHAMREIGSVRGEAEVLLSLGDLAFDSGDPDQARARYAEAQRLVISLGSLDEARVLARLARLDPPGQH